MSWGVFFPIYFAVVFFSVCIPAGFISYYYHFNGRGSSLMSQQAQSNFGLAFCFGCMLIAPWFGFKVKPVYTPGYVICVGIGISVLAIFKVRHLLFLIRGGKR